MVVFSVLISLPICLQLRSLSTFQLTTKNSGRDNIMPPSRFNCISLVRQYSLSLFDAFSRMAFSFSFMSKSLGGLREVLKIISWFSRTAYQKIIANKPSELNLANMGRGGEGTNHNIVNSLKNIFQKARAGQKLKHNSRGNQT